MANEGRKNMQSYAPLKTLPEVDAAYQPLHRLARFQRKMEGRLDHVQPVRSHRHMGEGQGELGSGPLGKLESGGETRESAQNKGD